MCDLLKIVLFSRADEWTGGKLNIIDTLENTRDSATRVDTKRQQPASVRRFISTIPLPTGISGG